MKKIILIASLAFSINTFAQTSSDIPTNEIVEYSSSIGNVNNSLELASCERCEDVNCVSLNTSWGTGYNEGTFYTQVTNNTNSTVTYKLCVLRKNGYWSCGTDQLKAYATSYKMPESNADGHTILYAAYGDWQTQECKFPDPNK